MDGRQIAYGVAGYIVLVSGLGWWQAQAAATAAPSTPIVAGAPNQVDTNYERYYNSRPLVSLTGAERHTKGPLQAQVTVSEFVDFR